jgi:hypothetical protein
MKIKIKRNSLGFGHVEGFLIFVVIFAIAGVGYIVASHAATTGTIPGPSGVTATPGDQQVTVKWDPVSASNFSYYAVRRSSTTSDPTQLSAWTRLTGNLTTTSVVDKGLSNGTKYYYYVTSINTSGQVGSRSQVVSAVPAGSSVSPAPAPGPTTNPTPPPPPASGGYTGTRLWDLKNGVESIAAGSVGHPPSQGGLGSWSNSKNSVDGYSSIEHDNDATVACSVTATREKARTGSQSMKLSISAPSATANTNDPGRCQPQASLSSHVGDDRYYGLSVYYDAGWEQATANQLGGRSYFLGGIGQRYSGTGENGPGANLGIGSFSGGPRFRTSINTTSNTTSSNSEIDLGPFVTGQWVDFVWHVRWKQDNTGILEAWRNGTKMGSWSGRTVLTNVSASKVAMHYRNGVYEGVKVNATRTLYVDNSRVCTTYDACNPAR